jgi:hypothetical protein
MFKSRKVHPFCACCLETSPAAYSFQKIAISDKLVLMRVVVFSGPDHCFNSEILKSCLVLVLQSIKEADLNVERTESWRGCHEGKIMYKI